MLLIFFILIYFSQTLFICVINFAMKTNVAHALSPPPLSADVAAKPRLVCQAIAKRFLIFCQN